MTISRKLLAPAVAISFGLLAGCSLIPGSGGADGQEKPDAAPRDEIDFELLPPLDISPARRPELGVLPVPGSAPAAATAGAVVSGANNSTGRDGVSNGGAANSPCRGEALYRIAFTAIWSVQTHPAGFPSGAHFSSPVALSHEDGAGFWAIGNFASPGIEQMAESGGTQILREELATLAAGGRAGDVVIGENFSSPGEEVIEVTVLPERSKISYVSMVAPSPDWFVGINGLETCGRNGWIEEIEVFAFPIDAGTDEGRSFRAENVDSDPKTLIALLSDSGDTQVRSIGLLAYGKILFTHIGSSEETAAEE